VIIPAVGPERTVRPLSNIGTYFFAGAIGGICNVCLTIWLLRVLGGPGYKSIGLALSASVFVTALTFEWLRLFALRFSAEPRALGSVYALYWMSAVALTAAAGLAALFGVGRNLEFGGLLIAAIATSQAVSDFLIVLARGAGNTVMVLLIQAGRGVAALVACGVTALATHDPKATLLALVCAQVAVSCVATLLFRGTLPRGAAFSRTTALQIFRFGGPLMASALINSLLSMSDRWVITFSPVRFPDSAIGGYIGVSDIYIRAFTFFAGILIGAFIQDISAEFDRGESGNASSRLSLMGTIFSMAVAPIVVASTVLANHVSMLLFANSSAHPTALLFAAIVIAVATHIGRNALVETLLLLEKRTILVLSINIACLAAAFAFSYILIPHLGMLGVPVGYTLASLAAGIVGVACMRRATRQLLVLKDATWFAAAALASGAVVRVLIPDSAPTWLMLASFAALYASAALFVLYNRLGRDGLKRLAFWRSNQ
jgi:O-antigen/teichoic acid export membrane protein